MAKTRLRCSDCQQFHQNRCQLDVPECRGAESVAAEECSCFLPASGIPVFMQEEEKQLALRHGVTTTGTKKAKQASSISPASGIPVFMQDEAKALAQQLAPFRVVQPAMTAQDAGKKGGRGNKAARDHATLSPVEEEKQLALF